MRTVKSVVAVLLQVGADGGAEPVARAGGGHRGPWTSLFAHPI